MTTFLLCYVSKTINTSLSFKSCNAGLLEGAHAGRGLGHEFLRHCQRARMLVHIIDGSSPDPVGDFSAIQTELELFAEDLASKPQASLQTLLLFSLCKSLPLLAWCLAFGLSCVHAVGLNCLQTVGKLVWLIQLSEEGRKCCRHEHDHRLQACISG